MKKIFALLLTASIFFVSCNDQGNGRMDRDDTRNGRNDRDNRDDRDRNRDDDYEANNDDGDNYRDDRKAKNSKGWTNSDRNQWRRTCNQAIGNAQPNAKELCDCVLYKMEAEYTSLTDADTRGGEAAGKRLMQECLGVGGGGGNDNYGDDEDY